MSLHIDPETISSLLVEYVSQPQNHKTFSRIVHLFNGTINNLASKYDISWYDDIYQEGQIGLLRALHSFPHENGPQKFISYARSTIKAKMVDFYRSTISKYPKYIEITQTINEYSDDFEPMLQLSKDYNYESTLTSALDQKYFYNGQLMQNLGITQRDYQVFIKYSINGYNLTEVAEMFKISVSQASKIVVKVRLKLIESSNKEI